MLPCRTCKYFRPADSAPTLALKIKHGTCVHPCSSYVHQVTGVPVYNSASQMRNSPNCGKDAIRYEKERNELARICREANILNVIMCGLRIYTTFFVTIVAVRFVLAFLAM